MPAEGPVWESELPTMPAVLQKDRAVIQMEHPSLCYDERSSPEFLTLLPREPVGRYWPALLDQFLAKQVSVQKLVWYQVRLSAFLI